VSNDPLARLREICLAFPEASEREGWTAAFEVRAKIFAWFLNNHHGDGRVAIWCKAPPGEQAVLVS
jgi:hypothetical protein